VRVSKRGLVLAGPAGDAALLEHPQATRLPEFLADEPGPATLAARLGDPNAEQLIAEMLEAGILTSPSETPQRPRRAGAHRAPRRRWVQVSRSGVELLTIEAPARWIDRHVRPILLSRLGRLGVLAVIGAGIACLAIGRPHGPLVSGQPAVDAVCGLLLALLLSALHELAHAVALVHYGRRPRRAGFGFYWGGPSFYVDSTEAMTLPRRPRVVQALAGLAVDAVTISVLAILAHTAAPVLMVGVCWRLAILGVLNLVTNLLPVLQLDGHWALADFLDEPDLATRSRAALGQWLRRSPHSGWLAAYGAVSLVGGVLLLGGGAVVWWFAVGDLVRALFGGTLAEVAVGLVLVGPFALSALMSLLGLVLEVFTDSCPSAAAE